MLKAQEDQLTRVWIQQANLLEPWLQTSQMETKRQEVGYGQTQPLFSTVLLACRPRTLLSWTPNHDAWTIDPRQKASKSRISPENNLEPTQESCPARQLSSHILNFRRALSRKAGRGPQAAVAVPRFRAPGVRACERAISCIGVPSERAGLENLSSRQYPSPPDQHLASQCASSNEVHNIHRGARESCQRRFAGTAFEICGCGEAAQM